MNAVVLLLVGLVLCFAGARSLRIGALASGFGATWLVADAFGASTGTALLVSAAGAVTVLILSIIVSRVLLFVAGVCAGGVIGARLLVLTTTGSADDDRWLLALVFVPTFALLCGFLAATFKHRFLAWATAVAGAALIVAGLGRIDTSLTDGLWRPDDTLGALAVTVLWVGFAIAGHRYQQHERTPAQHAAETSG